MMGWMLFVLAGLVAGCIVVYGAVVFELRRRHGLDRGLLEPERDEHETIANVGAVSLHSGLHKSVVPRPAATGGD